MTDSHILFDIISGWVWILWKSILKSNAVARRRLHSCVETLRNLWAYKGGKKFKAWWAQCQLTWPSVAAAHTRAHGGLIRVARTSLEGLRRTSPTPPPLLKPWLRTVTMHINRESQVRSISLSSVLSSATSEKTQRKPLTDCDWNNVSTDKRVFVLPFT